MTNYEAALFLHIAGMCGMFAGIGIEIGALYFAQRADDVRSVRTLMPMGALGGKSVPLFSLLVLATGAYMVEDVWRWDIAWIEISLAAFIVLFAMGPLINARRMKVIGIEAAQAPDGPLPGSLRAKLHDPVLHTSEITMTMATLGIVYLMVVKPGASGSWLALIVAVAAGLAIASLQLITARFRPGEPDAAADQTPVP